MSAGWRRRGGLIGWLILLSARHPLVVVAFALGCAALGARWALALPLDALPELADVQVVVDTRWDGRSPDQVEDQVTLPLSAALQATPRSERVRGLSSSGRSLVTVVFAEGVDPEWARARVAERLAGAAARLPAGAVPVLGPEAGGSGWIFQYALRDRSGRHDLGELSALQEYRIRYALAALPGVAEVASIGGALRAYEVVVDPLRLAQYHLTLAAVAAAVRAGNDEVGGRSIESAGHEQIISGRGRVHDAAELAAIPLALAPGGVPVLVRDVARVEVARAPGSGIAELDGEGEVVGGVVVMRYGQNALRVIDAIQQRLRELGATLPAGVELVTTYDRSPLIRGCLQAMRRMIIEELTVVALVVVLLLLHARSALIIVVALPVALALVAIPMRLQHLGADIMSLSGIAMAVGVVVDAAIIMLDNVHHRVGRGTPGRARRTEVVAALREVAPTIIAALLVIALAFLPVLCLEGSEGRLFRGLAWSKTWALVAALVLAVTLVPALCVLLLRRGLRPEGGHPGIALLARAYLPCARYAVRHPAAVLGAAALALAASVPVAWSLGGEFMPPFNEGSILYMPASPPGMAPSAALAVLQDMDRALRAAPEVASVFGKMGAAASATDPAPLSMAEVVVQLRPRAQWRPFLTWDGLIADLDRRLRIPGMPNLWWMPIQTRIEMQASGLRAPLGLALHGGAGAPLERSALAIEAALTSDARTAPFTRSAVAERRAGGFFCDIAIRRADAARYGLNAADINQVVECAVGGAALGDIIDGRQRYPITLRYERSLREDPAALARLPVVGAGGLQLALGAVADIRFSTGSPEIASEGGEALARLGIDVQGLGVTAYVARAQAVIAERVVLPPGARLEWCGEYPHVLHARDRLALIVPLTLAGIVALIALGTGSLARAGLVLAAVPFSLVGALWLLRLLHMKLNVAVAVGGIALAGIDAETGMVMLLYLELAWRQARAQGRLGEAGGAEQAILDGAARRLRPKLMTTLCLLAGLGPALWAVGSGAEAMRDIATPLVGGIATSALGELLVYPALFACWKGMAQRRPAAAVTVAS